MSNTTTNAQIIANTPVGRGLIAEATNGTWGCNDFSPRGVYTVCEDTLGKYIVDDAGDRVYGVPDPSDSFLPFGMYSADIFKSTTFKQAHVPYAVVTHTQNLTLTPMENGGWTVHIEDDQLYLKGRAYGAYTNAEDLLAGVKNYLEAGE